MLDNTINHFPRIYTGVKEVEIISDTEDLVLEEADSKLASLKNNQNIFTAEIEAIEEDERLYGIAPSPSTEDTEFRRQRIINRMSLKPPFTMRFLAKKFDELIGPGNWEAYVENDTLHVSSSAANQAWAEEITITVNKFKPASIVFHNNPYTFSNVKTSESVSSAAYTSNYKLGINWVLGSLPFKSLGSLEEVKMASNSSITDFLLNDMAYNALLKITSAKINDLYDVIVEAVSLADGKYIITYDVLYADFSELTEITNIKLLDASSNVCSNFNVYIPFVDDVHMVHNFNIKEGV